LSSVSGALSYGTRMHKLAVFYECGAALHALQRFAWW
jgi:hypothetical protein